MVEARRGIPLGELDSESALLWLEDHAEVVKGQTLTAVVICPDKDRKFTSVVITMIADFIMRLRAFFTECRVVFMLEEVQPS